MHIVIFLITLLMVPLISSSMRHHLQSSPRNNVGIPTKLLMSTQEVTSISSPSSPQTIKISPKELQLAELRKETIFHYDTNKYPFSELAREILETEAGCILPAMGDLHTNEKSNEQYTDGSGNSMNRLQALWNSNRCRDGSADDKFSSNGTACYERLDKTYHAFVKEVIGPLLGGGTIIYQRSPTLRIYTPGNVKAMGKLHNDMDYHHQPSELNYWLPLCSVFDTNSLWVESSPDLGDFHPMTMSYGEYCRFYGNQCRHFTKPNHSGHTRVSLDFRAVSTLSGGHDPNFRLGVRRGVKARFENKFDIGGFYVTCESENALPPITDHPSDDDFNESNYFSY